MEPDNSAASDAAIVPLLAILPDLIDYIQYRTEGNADKAALAILALPPQNMIAKLATRVEAGAAIHGVEPLRRVSDELKALSDGPERSAKIDELMRMIGKRAIDEHANAILAKVQNGEMPSAREAWFLQVAQKIYDES